MEEAIPSGGNAVPPAAAAAADRADEARSPSPLQRLASFRFTYVAFCAFVLLYVSSVRGVEYALALHFGRALEAAVRVDRADEGAARQIEGRVDALLKGSRWIRPGGVRVDPVVIGADGRTVLYAPGRRPLPEGAATPWSAHERTLLPVEVQVQVSVPHNSLVANGVLVFYAALLLTLLFVYTRILTRREEERLEEVIVARDALTERAAQIESELGAVRERLSHAEPARESDAAEVRALRGERASLLARLGELERREAALRADSAHTAGLQEEHRALEGLLDEALADLGRKDAEVRELQKQVRKGGGKSAREDEQLGRRLRTLYKNLEIDDRAIADLVGLRDEALKLRAEESLKRLSDDTENAAVRRKVGGLPPHLSIFELGFGGRGRIYYTKGRVRRFRALAIGDKASQKTDLEYLSRLPRDE
jgi:hypothetical protein